jgi:hypothetical protein
MSSHPFPRRRHRTEEQPRKCHCQHTPHTPPPGILSTPLEPLTGPQPKRLFDSQPGLGGRKISWVGEGPAAAACQSSAFGREWTPVVFKAGPSLAGGWCVCRVSGYAPCKHILRHNLATDATARIPLGTFGVVEAHSEPFNDRHGLKTRLAQGEAQTRAWRKADATVGSAPWGHDDGVVPEITVARARSLCSASCLSVPDHHHLCRGASPPRAEGVEAPGLPISCP